MMVVGSKSLFCLQLSKKIFLPFLEDYSSTQSESLGDSLSAGGLCFERAQTQGKQKRIPPDHS